MTRKTEWTKEEVIEAINGEGAWSHPEKFTGSLGNVMAISKRLNVERQTIYGYIKRWKSVAQAIDEQREMRKDIVEDKMMKRILEGSDTMMIFFAKTQMKDRGYIEKAETEHSGNITIKVEYDDADN